MANVTGMDWRFDVVDLADAERKTRFEITDRVLNILLLKDKATKLLKTQRSVPESDRTEPISSIRETRSPRGGQATCV